MSDHDRGVKAQHEFEKAMIHLIEAERLAAWGNAPNACVHSAYYGMHHCASAAILAAGGVGKLRDVPRVTSMSSSTLATWSPQSRAILVNPEWFSAGHGPTEWLPTTVSSAT